MDTLSQKQHTLGQRLREKRESLGLSIHDIAREVKVSPPYIRALEEGNYGQLSAKIYARGFLKRVLVLFGIKETGPWFEEFDLEWDIWVKSQKGQEAVSLERVGRGPHITPRRLVLGAGMLFLLVFLGFAGVRLRNFAGAPSLIIEEPADRIEVPHLSVQVRGRTEKESRLTVNGREITIDESGNFHEEVQLLPGANELEFIVKNRFGKETKIVRYVVVK